MTYFIFCIHNHQPVGNFDTVLEEAYRNSYWPFLKALSKHPAVKMTLHNSGFLLDWIIKNHHEYIDLLKAMTASGQVEIIGGGYYEPILPVIPEADRLAQIKMMSDKVEEVFNQRPRGIWLAERVWEPALPTTLRKAGIEYLLVDDYHFIKSGLSKDELGGYYLSEDQGNVIRIFPGSEALRYLIPFRPVNALEEHLRGLKGSLKRGDAAIYGDDGEKFGVWPGTGKWVFDEGWLESFFEKIENSLDWLKPVNMGEYVDNEGPLGTVYLPATSYMEMGEWSLPARTSKEYTELLDEVKTWSNAEKVRRFLQGGTWRNFFSKYPESNWMHKRMLRASRTLSQRSEGRPWDAKLTSAERFLYRAQCNDAYWHGVFGGLYLPHLRTKVYENLIHAETLAGADADLRTDGPSIDLSDFDADGRLEALMRTKHLNIFFSSGNGGALYELDYKPRGVNFSNTLSRWFEGYHHKLEYRKDLEQDDGTKSIHEMVKVKEAGLEEYLNYDSGRRASFVDHFLIEDEEMESFFANSHGELADFHNTVYDVSVKGGKVLLSRNGRLLDKAMRIEKEITARGDDSFRVDYTLKRGGGGAGESGYNFCVEFNLMLPCCDGPVCLYESVPPIPEAEGIGLGSKGKKDGIRRVDLIDKYTGVRLSIETDKPATLWRFPVHTVSLSEEGFEKIYQGSCLLFVFPPSFNGGSMSAGFNIKVEEIS